MRDAARIERLKTDPHSPGRFRADGTLRNQNSFVTAFDVKPADAMFGLVGFIPGTFNAWLVHRFVPQPAPVSSGA